MYDIYRYNTLQISTKYFNLNFFSQRFWLQCPSIRHFRRMFFEFRFRFYPVWNCWYASTEIRSDISQDLAIFRKRTHVNLPLVRACQFFATNWRGEAQRCLTAGSSGNRSAWKAFRLTRVSVKRISVNRGSTVWDLTSFGTLCSVEWQLFTDVPGQRSDPIFKSQPVFIFILGLLHPWRWER
jgi:hypothetical protein